MRGFAAKPQPQAASEEGGRPQWGGRRIGASLSLNQAHGKYGDLL